MNIDNNQEFEALCARLLPKFNEYLQRHSKNIFSCELATSLDGISSMPALYSLKGVQKQVIAPLSLLTKDVDVKIEEAKQATEAANTAAGKANDAAASVTQATLDLTTERKKVEDAVTASKTATEAAITSSKAQTDLAQELNEHPVKMGDNGNWWQWNIKTHAYEDTGIVARGGAMYPTFKHMGNKLYIVDYGSNVSERIVKKGNKLVFRI